MSRALVGLLALLSSGAAPNALLRLDVLASDGGYVTIEAGGWSADGGLVLPVLPPGLAVAGSASLGVCSDATLCVSDGGMAATTSTTPACVCAKDATCLATPPDGGLPVAAPTGFTLPAAGWTSPTGAGCVPKVCTEIFGHSSWPAGCPP